MSRCSCQPQLVQILRMSILVQCNLIAERQISLQRKSACLNWCSIEVMRKYFAKQKKTKGLGTDRHVQNSSVSPLLHRLAPTQGPRNGRNQLTIGLEKPPDLPKWPQIRFALYIAAQKGHEAVVSALIAAGADKNAAKRNGATPLYIAAEKGHEAVVSALKSRSTRWR